MRRNPTATAHSRVTVLPSTACTHRATAHVATIETAVPGVRASRTRSHRNPRRQGPASSARRMHSGQGARQHRNRRPRRRQNPTDREPPNPLPHAASPRVSSNPVEHHTPAMHCPQARRPLRRNLPKQALSPPARAMQMARRPPPMPPRQRTRPVPASVAAGVAVDVAASTPTRRKPAQRPPRRATSTTRMPSAEVRRTPPLQRRPLRASRPGIPRPCLPIRARPRLHRRFHRHRPRNRRPPSRHPCSRHRRTSPTQ